MAHQAIATSSSNYKRRKKALRMHHVTVRSLVTSGKIKAVKGGKAWLVHPDSIAEWMKAGTPGLREEEGE